MMVLLEITVGGSVAAKMISSQIRTIEVINGKPHQRSILEDDIILIRDVEITGWNTRVTFEVTHAERSYVPTSMMHYWTHVGKSYYFDFRNDAWGKIPKEMSESIKVIEKEQA